MGRDRMQPQRVALLLPFLAVAACGENTGVGLHLTQEGSSASRKLTTGNTSFGLDDFSDLTFCQATSTASLLIVGGSSGFASASSSCQGKVEATSSVTEQVSGFVNNSMSNPERICTKETVVQLAEAIGNSFASAYTLARLELIVDGTGVACADASAEADTYATAFAKSVLRDAVETQRLNPVDGTTSTLISGKRNGLCLAASLSAVFAKAWAESKVAGCVEGTGDFVDEQISFSRSVQNAIARVLVEIGERSCAANADGLARMKAFEGELNAGKTYEVDTEAIRAVMSEFADGVAEASGGSLLQCDGESSKQCCGTDTSGCELSRRAGVVLKKSEEDRCCCVEGLLPYYQRQ